MMAPDLLANLYSQKGMLHTTGPTFDNIELSSNLTAFNTHLKFQSEFINRITEL